MPIQTNTMHFLKWNTFSLQKIEVKKIVIIAKYKLKWFLPFISYFILKDMSLQQNYFLFWECMQSSTNTFTSVAQI
jgi:hypothetical protein